MKKKMIVVALVLFSSAAVFASGNKDDDYEYYGRGPMGGGWNDRGFDGRGGMFWSDEDGNPITPEEISAQGTLVLEEGTIPYLKTAEGKVFLMIPPFAMDDVDLKGGESIKVTGYDIPSDRWGNETESVFLHVLSAEINGKTLTLDMDRMGRTGRSGRGGRPGNFNRGCW
ncbi:hypothetical protein [Oceanispirochaeta sp.]|jgi:hypothetical protein|uniref:hypothetical protein n=1 Tax=Oceanispirochaeta sp. TaxID=2035350 RepID=UPI002612DF61|nr:hypothetical protein [Oceanispirochaeta sp.]MDA3955853.1 hypothetical protein [Oceanispirochaeta sp.]